ncbi:MAG: hypothetical protein JXM73_03350 [Anaerolineae bacterium]|nr:hypothetical protein [Anaerolineae bacterium]
MTSESAPMSPWLALAALAATLLLLLWVAHWITRRLHFLGMRWLNDPDLVLWVYFALILPGVVLHELSHFLTAWLLGVRASLPAIGPERSGSRRSGRVSLGSVRVAKADPLRYSLIGLAPLLAGATVIFLIGAHVLGVDELTGRGLDGFWAGLGDLLRVPDVWLWLYLIFAISNAMLPSESDMQPVRPVLIFLGIVAVVAVVVVGLPNVPPAIVAGVSAFAAYLASAFALTLAVDAVFMLVIALLCLLTNALKPR